MPILIFRCAAIVLSVALVLGPISPLAYAEQTAEERDCQRDGGVWNGTSCDFPTPEEQCALDGGTWSGTECDIPPTPEEQCVVGGGTWNGVSCDMPAPDACPNVPGNQSSTPCADAQCWTAGGIWDGDSCDNDTSESPSGGQEESSGDEVGTTATDAGAPGSNSSSASNSADVDPDESDTDNTDFIDETGGPDPADPNEEDDVCTETRTTNCVLDVSATSTEAAAPNQPFFATDSDIQNEGNENKEGVVSTGEAIASTAIKNVLNITRVNGIDELCHPGGPGVASKCTNSSLILASTENEAELVTDGEANAQTGQNTARGGTGMGQVATGKASASADVINVVNTNFFNSDGLILFQNPESGVIPDLDDINLSYFFEGGPGKSPSPTAEQPCTILTCLNSADLQILNKNTADVDNTVTVRATTGLNTATSSANGDAVIQTGDAYAAANVLNMANTNFINSSYFVVSYTTFGDQSRNIVLPNASFFEQLLANGNSLPELQSSSFIVNNNNDENFFGTTTATAITGNNTASSTATGHGQIFTGNAYSGANNFTSANQTRVGGSSAYFAFRIWGAPVTCDRVKDMPRRDMECRWARASDNKSTLIEIFSRGGAPGESFGTYNSSTFLASSTNLANVHTEVEVLATTGENLAEVENGVAAIETGDAYATANVVNLVNTNIVNRNWVFGVYNIFGDLEADITFGGSSSTTQPPPPPPPPPSPPPSGGGDTSPPPPPPPPPPSQSAGKSSGGGGGGAGKVVIGTAATTSAPRTTPVVFVSSNSIPGVSTVNPRTNPKITITKTATLSASTTPQSIVIDYKVVVENDKEANAAHQVILTDTLYDPSGADIYTRSWPLDSLLPGDQVTLTYSIAFDAYTTLPGTYRNIARITGQRNNTIEKKEVRRIPAKDAIGDVVFVLGQPTGQVLGASASCPLLSGYLVRGSANSGEVMKLQGFLNAEVGAGLPLSGLYGPMTAAAVVILQEKYRAEILTPVGLSRGTGSVYNSTLNKINALACGGVLPITSAATGAVASNPAPTTPKPAAPKPKPAGNTGGNAFVNALGSWFSGFAPR